jgi:Zn-dependent protease with chaperone function
MSICCRTGVVGTASALLAVASSVAYPAQPDFWSQFFADQHAPDAIRGALSAPIPSEYVAQARQVDDSLLSKNDFLGNKAYLVTDERLEKLEALTSRLLEAMGEKPDDWVIRFLDSDPAVQNAFVTGGKYIYVFTGLVDTSDSDDELAFVLSHEIGHSMLKHAYRRSQSWEGVVGAIAGALAERSATASAVSTVLTSNYSREDEREADALAVVIARKAGFNPLRGADMFSRMVRQEERDKSSRDEELVTMRNEAQAALAACKQFSSRYQNCSGIEHMLTDCAEKLNAICADAETRRVNYNHQLALASQADADKSLSDLASTHPPDQERIASIAALTDYLKGKRGLDTLNNYPQAHRVMWVLNDVKSNLLDTPSLPPRPIATKDGSGQSKDVSPVSDVEGKLKQLKSLHDQGLITTDEYHKKKAAILGAM